MFDVGANIGQSALVAASLTGPAGRVVSFEPNPAALAGLRAAVLRSGFANIEVVALALSNHSGWVDFFIDTRAEYTAVASSLRELEDLAASGMSQRTTAECATLDDYCARSGFVPDVIKIDVESAEPLVIEGGRGVIESRRPVMLFEFWETWWSKGFRELFDYLSPLYRLIRKQDGVDVERYYRETSGTKAVDILCLPRSGDR
ncbi:MAG: FkbM family methyltransferase [Bryobacteraceae bacterium]|nr:FkbM family methyltransferase [Bryobacteraceae bacterium]